jgi:hypothetical protein
MQRIRLVGGLGIIRVSETQWKQNKQHDQKASHPEISFQAGAVPGAFLRRRTRRIRSAPYPAHSFYGVVSTLTFKSIDNSKT